MSLDGLAIQAITYELQGCIGGRISKIHQPSPHDLVLLIRAQNENKRLLISANPTYPRFHFTTQSFQNPQEAPMFCMLLRKHCEGGIIDSIEQIGLERVIHLRIRQRDELGDIRLKTLIIELMGRHSNIILLEPSSGTILDGIHHVTPAISSYRVVMPGVTYTAPPDQKKLDPFSLSKQQWLESFASGTWSNSPHADSLKEELLVQQFSGISPFAAREIVHRLENNGIDAVTQFMERLRQHQYEPTLLETANGKTFFAPYEITHLSGKTQSFATFSECMEAFYGDKAERDTVKQKVSDLLKLLQNERNKNEKKLGKLYHTMEEAKDADQYRIHGELLTASLHLVERGQKQIEVLNYYEEDPSMITIALDPQLSPSENAQRYFRKYTKSKNSLVAVREQIEQTKEEISYIDTLLQQLRSASLQDIDEIRDELIEQGYLRNRNPKANKKKKDAKPKVSCFTSSEGVVICVGKNNTQNDYLTNRLADNQDTWLHTKDVPGSHVVIRAQSFGEATLYEAAQLAAYFSQARESSQVAVDYTLIRHVRKPNGAKPGFVIYDHHKTIYVTPDEEQIAQLRATTT